jgi:prepilin signal peptidase PulO-like enzyme (type II secretory pathway)
MDFLFAAFVAAMYACAAFLAVQLSATVCKTIEPFEDGPQPGRPPTLWLIAGAALAGGILALRGGSELPHLALGAVLLSALVAAWHADVLTGIVPDWFTLGPIALFVIVGVFTHDYGRVIAALITAAPFAVAAVISKGLGMGWGDVKLAALGGIAIGAWQPMIPFFIGACLVAAGVAVLRRRKHEPIAFAPYLAGAIGVAFTVT